MTGTWQDEKIAELVAEHGFEGYGFYWRTLEIIAANSDENSRYSCQLSAKVWAKLYGISAKRCQKLLEVLAKLRLVRLKISEKIIDISIPNIGKYRDEYSRKSSAEKAKAPDKLRTSSGQTPAYSEAETDTEADNRNTDTEAEDKPEKIPGLYCDLLKALGKLQLTPEEYSIGEKLINNGCEIKDVENARLAKGKNNLKYLQNIVCEMRDQRLKEKEVHTFEFV